MSRECESAALSSGSARLTAAIPWLVRAWLISLSIAASLAEWSKASAGTVPTSTANSAISTAPASLRFMVDLPMAGLSGPFRAADAHPSPATSSRGTSPHSVSSR